MLYRITEKMKAFAKRRNINLFLVDGQHVRPKYFKEKIRAQAYFNKQVKKHPFIYLIQLNAQV